MKNSILFLLFIFSFFSIKAQQWDVGFTIGSGSVYVIENVDNAVNSSYGAPSLFSAYVKFLPKEAFFGLKVKYLNLNSSLNGKDWQNLNQSIFPADVKGFVENRTVLFQLERLNTAEAKFSLGYNFGIGVTNEVLAFDKQGQNSFESMFSVLSLGGIFSYALGKQLSLRLEPSLVWNDPLRSFDKANYRMGGEDLHLLVEVGINYRLK